MRLEVTIFTAQCESWGPGLEIAIFTAQCKSWGTGLRGWEPSFQQLGLTVVSDQ